MDRQQATQLTRDLLNSNGLTDWKIRLATDLTRPWLGKCVYDDKTIYLNAHHIDTHPSEEVDNTIRHEIAHALTPGHSHDEIWAEKAHILGCTNTMACATYSLDARAIDAIRSGKTLEVTFDEQIIRTPKYKITQLSNNCPTCGVKAIEVHSFEAKGKKIITLKCGHVIIKVAESFSPFESIVSNDWKPEIKSCQHEWDKNQCVKCREYKLFPFQVESARFLEKSNGRAGVFHEMGLGKGQILTDLVLTPDGWLSFGNLKIGQEIFGADGNIYQITNIFDRGKLFTYKVTFTDGSYCTVDGEHLWQVNTPLRNYREQNTITKNTTELMFDLKTTSGNNKWQVQVTKPIKLSEQNQPIDPYLLGVLLGDGSFRGNRVSLTSIDNEIISQFFFKRQDKITYYLDKSYSKIIKDLNLWGCNSESKFIPSIYKYGSINQRYALLQGLMDTDGSIWNNNVIEYSTVSPQLSEGFRFLVESLGGTVKISTKQGHYIKNGERIECKLVYRLIINLPANPFRLSRKRDLFKNRTKYGPIRVIESIEPSGINEVRCISVNSPDNLYITNNCIVTHNTVISLAWLKYHPEAFPVLWIVKSGIKFQWAKEIVRWLGQSHVPQVIQTSDDALFPLKGYVVSYDMLVPKVRTRNGKTITSGFDIEKFKKAGIKTVITDECQQIKNVDSTRTHMVRRVLKDTPHFIPLSGTPWKNRGDEYFPVLNMLDPYRFSSHNRFLNEWVDYYFDGAHQKMGGIKNPKRFKEHTKDLLIRFERSEVMKELPTVQRSRYYVQMDEDNAKAYNTEVDDFVKYWNTAVIGGDEDSFGTSQNILARLTKMRHLTGLAKIPNTVEFVKEFLEDTDRKIVIFVHHKDVGQIILDILTKHCREEGYPAPLKLTADLSSEERFATQERFNSPDYRVLVASTLASGEGLNLQSCSDCVMHERQWNPANEEQAEGRFIRIGQTATSVSATYALAEGAVDSLFDGIVERKRAYFHATMNSGEAPRWNESSIMVKELAEAIVKQGRI